MAHRPSRLTARLSGRTLALAVGILLLLTVFVLANHVFHFEELLKPERIASWLDEVGPLAPLVLILMMAVAVIISPIPSLPLDLAAGAAFGPGTSKTPNCLWKTTTSRKFMQESLMNITKFLTICWPKTTSPK